MLRSFAQRRSFIAFASLASESAAAKVSTAPPRPLAYFKGAESHSAILAKPTAAPVARWPRQQAKQRVQLAAPKRMQFSESHA